MNNKEENEEQPNSLQKGVTRRKSMKTKSIKIPKKAFAVFEFILANCLGRRRK